MRIAALGNVNPSDATQRVINGRDAVRIAGHVVLQAVFLAPGLAAFGVRDWKLLGASLGGSLSFTVLSWLWAYANGFELTPLSSATERAAQGPAVPDMAAPGPSAEEPYWGQVAGIPRRRMRPRPKLDANGPTRIIDV